MHPLRNNKCLVVCVDSEHSMLPESQLDDEQKAKILLNKKNDQWHFVDVDVTITWKGISSTQYKIGASYSSSDCC